MNDKGLCPGCERYRSYKREPVTETYTVRGTPVTIDTVICVCDVCGESWDTERDLTARVLAKAGDRTIDRLQRGVEGKNEL